MKEAKRGTVVVYGIQGLCRITRILRSPSGIRYDLEGIDDPAARYEAVRCWECRIIPLQPVAVEIVVEKPAAPRRRKKRDEGP